ncbi:MAG: 23S rRNA (uracil(1939)-C(5))-methyltransferase RlmD [Coriobacteriales bacterium]|jgi:23S rRNA (uracil1939-C5)-methyltransferase
MGYKTYTCPVARACGGCEWLSVPYPIQLERKHAQVERLFSDFDAPIEPCLGMDEPLRFRAKIQSPFVRGRRAGVPRFGMYARHSHELVECKDCLVEYPQGRPILATVAELCRRFKIEPYDEDSGRGLLRHVVVRVAAATGQVMVTLVVNHKEFPRRRAFVAALRDAHPEIATVIVNVNTRKTNAILGPHSQVVYGQGWIEDKLCGCRFRIPATAFYQTNPAQTDRLYRCAIDLAGLEPGMSVYDAYCGIGTIGIIAAHEKRCAVTGVESVGPAVEAAKANARLNHVKDAQFAAGDAGEVLRANERPFDVLFMDPPRAGSSELFLQGVMAAAPERIVYISCNPTTQVRDIKYLSGGYQLERVVPVDMFPHTKHIETVGLLSRA